LLGRFVIRIKTSHVLRLPLLVILVTCGPPLTDASSHNITGHWTTVDPVGPVQNISMDITQGPDGAVAGTWSGKVTLAAVSCPPELGSTPSGPVDGTYKVVGIALTMLGVGDMEGQEISPGQIRGSILSCGTFYLVHFSLRPQPSGG